MGPGLILPVLGASLYIGFSHCGSGPGKWLSTPWVVYLGKISFSLYLWHWPVIVFAREFGFYDSVSLVPILGMMTITLLLSVASYHCVEVPLRRKDASLLPVQLGFVGCLIFGVSIIGFDKDSYYDTSAFEPVSFHVHHYDVTPELAPWSASKGRKCRESMRRLVVWDLRMPIVRAVLLSNMEVRFQTLWCLEIRMRVCGLG